MAVAHTAAVTMPVIASSPPRRGCLRRGSSSTSIKLSDWVTDITATLTVPKKDVFYRQIRDNYAQSTSTKDFITTMEALGRNHKTSFPYTSTDLLDCFSGRDKCFQMARYLLTVLPPLVLKRDTYHIETAPFDTATPKFKCHVMGVLHVETGPALEAFIRNAHQQRPDTLLVFEPDVNTVFCFDVEIEVLQLKLCETKMETDQDYKQEYENYRVRSHSKLDKCKNAHLHQETFGLMNPALKADLIGYGRDCGMKFLPNTYDRSLYYAQQLQDFSKDPSIREKFPNGILFVTGSLHVHDVIHAITQKSPAPTRLSDTSRLSAQLEQFGFGVVDSNFEIYMDKDND